MIRERSAAAPQLAAAQRIAPVPRLAAAVVVTVVLSAVVLGVAPATCPAAGVKLPIYREISLPNGALLLLSEKHDVPLIAFSAMLRGGSLADPPGKEGLANLTADLLRKGAGKRTAREIAATVDGAGARLGTGSGLEATTVSGEFMTRDQALLVEILSDLLRRPTFPEDEFEKLKAQFIDGLISAKDDPLNVIGDYAFAFFYGEHPYARPESGDEATLKAITRQDVLDYYRAHYGGDRLTLAVVGDFSAASMESRLRKALADWPKASSPAPTAPEPARQTGRRVLLVDKPDATQSYFWIGNLGVARKDPDRVPFGVANTAYGGRYTSILNTSLRIQSGLTYGARWSTPRLTQPGTAAISTYTKTESTERAVDLALATLADVRRGGLDAATLEGAKAYILGQYPPRLETEDQLAAALVDLSFYGLGRDEIEGYLDRVIATPLEDVTRAIRRIYPPGEDLVFVFIGNASKIREVVKQFGPVKEVRITEPLTAALK